MSDSAQRKLSAVLDDREAVAGFSRLSIAVVITNPRAPDNPIVYVNEAFERVTGYSRAAVIGRNCRFLQGERTEKSDVDRIRTAVAVGRDVTVDILNYRASGEPFRNRLIIAPITDEDGAPVYFLGLQKEMRAGDASEDDIDAHLGALRARVRDDLSMILANIGSPERRSSLEDPLHEVEALPRRLECLELAYEEMRLTDGQTGRAGIDIGALLSRVASTIAHHEGRPGVRFTAQVDQIEVGLEEAVRVALVASETLSNAFIHAFAGLDRGYVGFRVTRLGAGGLRMTVSDDGVGIPPNIDWPSAATRGGRLIASLLDGLDATINVARGAAGTVVLVDVPVDPQELNKKGV